MMNLPCDIGQVPYHNVKFTRTASLKLALGPHFWQNEGHKRSWLFYGLALCQKRKPQVVSVSCFRESQERLCFLRRCGQTVYKKTIELCFCTFTYPELQKKDTSFIRSYRSLLNNFFVENIQIFDSHRLLDSPRKDRLTKSKEQSIKLATCSLSTRVRERMDSQKL